ncbi:MAG: dethiobiotin synthase [Candidatus Gastranaerophilales bacterium]|nr:dethiobiotin synthase [Candidatus Gastranaerophilales bacterium]
MNIFVTGTDTDIGKTVVTAGLAAVMQSLGYKAGVLKPLQSGAIIQGSFMISPDLSFVKRIDPYVTTQASYILKEPTAPYIAAELENVEIDLNVIQKDYSRMAQTCDTVIVEGSGGLLVPVAPHVLMSELPKKLNLPCVIVARPDLGTINHTLLTINQAISEGLKVSGVIINRYPEGTEDYAIKTAPRMIEEYSDAKILGIIKDFDTKHIQPSVLIDAMVNSVDLEKIFNVKIPKLDMGL